MTSAVDLLFAELVDIDGLHVERDVSTSTLSTYRVGGPVDLLLRVESRDALVTVVSVFSRHSVATLPIGKGSNLLVSDAGFRGAALVLGEEFGDVSFDGTTMTAGAAAALPVAARASVASGLSGFEWAVGVPGSIGGAVRMNAGGHGSDMAANLVSVEIADLAWRGGMKTLTAEQLDLRYRYSNLMPWQVVVRATMKLDDGASVDGATELKDIVSWRRENQPGGANAGSVFRNPSNDSAGRLIEAAGLKGLRIGSAAVSEKHANFIQADPEGSADDIVALMVEIVDRVEKHAGIRLHAETRLVGFDEELTLRLAGLPYVDVQRDNDQESVLDDAKSEGSATDG